jgi:hypothetical protein
VIAYVNSAAEDRKNSLTTESWSDTIPYSLRITFETWEPAGGIERSISDWNSVTLTLSYTGEFLVAKRSTMFEQQTNSNISDGKLEFDSKQRDF